MFEQYCGTVRPPWCEPATVCRGHRDNMYKTAEGWCAGRPTHDQRAGLRRYTLLASDGFEPYNWPAVTAGQSAWEAIIPGPCPVAAAQSGGRFIASPAFLGIEVLQGVQSNNWHHIPSYVVSCCWRAFICWISCATPADVGVTSARWQRYVL